VTLRKDSANSLYDTRFAIFFSPCPVAEKAHLRPFAAARKINPKTARFSGNASEELYFFYIQ
jgi:hypothetical protein